MIRLGRRRQKASASSGAIVAPLPRAVVETTGQTTLGFASAVATEVLQLSAYGNLKMNDLVSRGEKREFFVPLGFAPESIAGPLSRHPDAVPPPGSIMLFEGTRGGRTGASWLSVGEESKLFDEEKTALATSLSAVQKVREVTAFSECSISGLVPTARKQTRVPRLIAVRTLRAVISLRQRLILGAMGARQRCARIYRYAWTPTGDQRRGMTRLRMRSGCPVRLAKNTDCRPSRSWNTRREPRRCHYSWGQYSGDSRANCVTCGSSWGPGRTVPPDRSKRMGST